MTTLRFVGDLPLALGIALALAMAVASYLYYRRESFDLPGSLSQILPVVRSLAIALTVFILAGPVLHHRQEIGELGTVRLVVDASPSMEVNDDQMEVARKLRIAHDHGWLPEGQFDPKRAEHSDVIRVIVRRATEQLHADELTASSFEDLKSRLQSDAEQIEKMFPSGEVTLVSLPEDELAARRETFQKDVIERLKNLESPPQGESAAVTDAFDQLAEIVRSLEEVGLFFDESFKKYAENWIASTGEAAQNGLRMFDQSNRQSRIQSRLMGDTGLIRQLTETHHIELYVLDSETPIPVWNSRSLEPLPEALPSSTGIPSTDLATAMAQASLQLAESGKIATVLLTDGQHNRGPSPIQQAQSMHAADQLVYCVGYGTQVEPNDLVLLAAEYPDTLHKTDRLKGSLLIKDRMPAGTPFVVQIKSGNTVLWQSEQRSMNVAERSLDFELSVNDLTDDAKERFSKDVQHHSIQLDLQAQIVPVEAEIDRENNSQLIRVAAITQRQKLLLLDGRSRWEARYLKNMFERDSGWEINPILVGPGNENLKLQRGDGLGRFPDSRESLFGYDLIIFGDVATDLLSETEREWVQDFVEHRGGGIVFIDGMRRHLQRAKPEGLGSLIPVSWLEEGEASKSERMQLTQVGGNHPALLLGPSQENDKLWQRLPAPHRVIKAEALPGTEVLVEAISGTTTYPLVTTRNYGGGKVMYFAFDETWRWRYSVADIYHQRFWNQVARWVMPRPFAISDKYLSLDTGSPQQDQGNSTPIRAKLTGPDGTLVSNAMVDALVWKNEQIVATIPLSADPSIPGTYQAMADPLPAGEYRVTVRASGFAESAFKASSSFVVKPRSNVESQRIACNEELLGAVVMAGGGQYLREERLGELVSQLAPLSSGRIIESDTLLWQSWYWFALIITLLALEWFLRKRNGLL